MRSYAAVPPGRAVAYRHRDPAWVSPARLAELEARDRRREQLERPRQPGPPPPRGGRDAAWKARMARFAELRESGLSRKEAAAEMGIGKDAARRYEAARKRAGGTA